MKLFPLDHGSWVNAGMAQATLSPGHLPSTYSPTSPLSLGLLRPPGQSNAIVQHGSVDETLVKKKNKKLGPVPTSSELKSP